MHGNAPGEAPCILNLGFMDYILGAPSINNIGGSPGPLAPWQVQQMSRKLRTHMTSTAPSTVRLRSTDSGRSCRPANRAARQAGGRAGVGRHVSVCEMGMHCC